MERHFECTACGKCCQGWLPLALDDAIAHADRFPLFVLWTPVRPGGKSFDLTARLGVVVEPKRKKKAAVRVTAFSYVPSHLPCPALLSDGLCAVHETKPQRCKTMPFSGARTEHDQTDLLIPRPGWECDVSGSAPVVYSGKTIVARDEFARERARLEADAKVLKPYAQFMLAGAHKVRQDVDKMALRPQGGHVILSFTTLTPRLPQVDIQDFAAKQLRVMESFADLTADNPEHVTEHKRYVEQAEEWRQISTA